MLLCAIPIFGALGASRLFQFDINQLLFSKIHHLPCSDVQTLPTMFSAQLAARDELFHFRQDLLMTLDVFVCR
jgi:hypothetical protein